MTTPIPLWADKSYSQKLPSIRALGEGDACDFKKEFPEQGHKLAKTIAAFASSGGGDIFIGVDDAGELVGIASANGAERDKQHERAHGIASSVSPVPAIEIKFAVEDGRTILIIHIVQQQAEPIYYYDGRPYIRDGRRARPAEPSEVKNRVWSHPSSEQKRDLEKLNLKSMELHSQRMAATTQNIAETSAAVRKQFNECR